MENTELANWTVRQCCQCCCLFAWCSLWRWLDNLRVAIAHLCFVLASTSKWLPLCVKDDEVINSGTAKQSKQRGKVWSKRIRKCLLAGALPQTVQIQINSTRLVPAGKPVESKLQSTQIVYTGAVVPRGQKKAAN